MKARLLELLLGQIIALVPFVVVWWVVLLDDEEREGHLEDIRAWARRVSGLELAEWVRSPELAFARHRLPAMLDGEFSALGIENQADLEAFVAGLDADIDELEAEGITE